jgi:hypothetical protein
MGNRTSHPPELAMAALAVLASVVVLSSMPPVWSMVVAVLAAVSWCLWLDGHPAP